MGANFLRSFIFASLIASIYCQDCSVTIQDLVLTQSEEVLVASWTLAENTDGCEVLYNAVISNNVDTLDPVLISTTETSLVISDAVPCSETTVEVSTVGGNSVSASILLETSVTTAPVLRAMITSCNSIQMIWDAQPYEENICTVTHFQMFCLSDTHNFTIPQAVEDVRNRTFNILITVLQPDIYYTCNGFIFVTLAGFSPPSDNIEFWSNLDSVRDLKVQETETALRVTWEAPLNSEECGVAYDVTYENEVLGTATREVTGLSYDLDIEIIPCTDYTITVTPISYTESRGTPVSEVITPSVRVGQVSYLEVIDDYETESIVLSWSEVQVGRCVVTFMVEHVVDSHETLYATTSTMYRFERVPCSTNLFSVLVVSEGIIGDAVTISFELDSSDIKNVGPVRNLAFDGSLLSWNAPSTVGLCDIAYRVNLVDDVGTSEFIVYGTSQDLDLIPCSTNVIYVVGFFEELEGELTSIDVIANSEVLTPPTHVSTVPSFTSAEITLRAQSMTENMCTIEEALLECSSDNGDSFERSIGISDDPNREFTLNVDGLEEDAIYTCLARWEGSIPGNTFSFRTIPLAIKELTISDIGQDSFLVSWSEDYGQQFVNGYILTVESLGPLHSVPDRCDIERGAIFQFELPNTELSSVFIQGFPNYMYKASLTTSYTLGVERTSTEASDQTLTGAPGLPDILEVNWVSSESTMYDTSVNFIWQAPCDLNGSLRGFGFNVTANFAVSGTSQTVTVDDSFSASETEVDGTFANVLSDINPFFTYEVAINVVAAEEGRSEVLYLTPPTACVCPVK